MKAQDLILRCYAKREGDQWVAVCLDLCLAAQHDTLEGVKERLEEQIIDYVEEAMTVDHASAGMLLSRKAPLLQRIEYHMIAAAQKLHVMGSRIRTAFSTTLPLRVGKSCHA